MSNSLLVPGVLAWLLAAPALAQGVAEVPAASPARASLESTAGAPQGREALPGAIRFQLGNGLRVVLAPEPGRGRVAVAVGYHVGERDDPPGYRGLAHLTEHVMFEGMARGTASSFDEWLARAGATGMNGITDRDYTTYFQELPSSEVKLNI